MRYMLDTNICIYLMKAHPPEVLARLLHLDHGDVVMSIITYAELRVGLEGLGSTRAQNERALHLLTSDIPVLPFDEAVAERYGVQRAAVRDRRRDALDRLIAAHAASLGLTLVTNNEADFRDYPGLVVENWV
ncbi:type II toxin-antitoxin system VapC family toxin [Thiobacillus sp.]|uniref:type II toxin-antitoxin system VapC family toxin n=1 Tax=Thiobacillus sp. TaxID=924 RepID=UPI0025F8F0AF|nr:type II toxin-antitoxin system VapC family toxin [Thiobacillus sp.]